MSRSKSCYSVRRRRSSNHTKTLKVFQISVLLCVADFVALCTKHPTQNTFETQYTTWRTAGSGPAFASTTEILHVNTMAWILRLVPGPKIKRLGSGGEPHRSNHSSCHKFDLGGNPSESPPLKNIGREYNESRRAAILRRGGGRVPVLAQVGKGVIQAIATDATTGNKNMATATWNKAETESWLTYMSDGCNKSLDPNGYPAAKLPRQGTPTVAGNAIPIMFQFDGQCTMIGPKGGKWGVLSSGAAVAFALPQSSSGGKTSFGRQNA